MSRTKPCIRCNSRCSLFWYTISVGGNDIGELCDYRLQGMTWKAIAEEMNLNVSTIKNHRKEIEDEITEIEVEDKIWREVEKDTTYDPYS